MAPPPFPDPAYPANRMMFASAALAVGGGIVAWLFLSVDLERWQHGLPVFPWHLMLGLGGILFAVVCAYGAVEHFLDRGQEGVHEARAWMAWSAMLTGLGAMLIFTARLEFPLPYPSAAQAIGGQISQFSVNQQPSSVTLHVRLGTGPAYSYECSHSTRNGWCGRHDALVMAAAMRPHDATLLPLGGNLLMLNVDGTTVIDWTAERDHRLYIGASMLLLGIALLLFGAHRFRAAMAWAQGARVS